MSLYEFTFIAQQGLLQQEVEEMVQELAISLKNIKADVLFQRVKSFIEEGNSTVIKQKSGVDAESVKESLIVYSDFLEGLTKILWIELEEDFSNLKEIKSKIDKELKSGLSDMGITRDLITVSGANTKSAFIYNVVSAFKEDISQHLIKILQEVSRSFKIVGSNQLSKTLEVLLKNIEASGLIKYEYWGLLDFAYPINKMKSGHYCMMCINSASDIMAEFERRIKLNENIIRHFSVRVNEFFKGKSYMIDKQIEGQSA